jgi:hypothetical protein
VLMIPLLIQQSLHNLNLMALPSVMSYFEFILQDVHHMHEIMFLLEPE